MSISLVIWILFIHWVADFIFQNDRMALNKSKSMVALFNHSLIYTIMLGGPLMSFDFVYKLQINPFLVLLNLPAHFITDGITSRMTTWLYNKGERHWFFVVIGLDQFLHYVVLFLTI